jgi:hypothetical protein
VSKFQSVGGVVFFQQVSIQVLPHLTNRASDVWEPARFTSISCTRGFEFFLLPNIVHARPHAGTANRWLASLKYSIAL